MSSQSRKRSSEEGRIGGHFQDYVVKELFYYIKENLSKIKDIFKIC